MPPRGTGGSGVSTQRLPNGRYRIRWRETVREADGTERRVQRSLVVSDRATADKVATKVRHAVEAGELYEREAVRIVPPVATLDAVLEGWLKGRAAYGVAPGTLRAYGDHVARILRGFRELRGLAEEASVPGTELTRDRVNELTTKLRADKIAPSTLRQTIGALVGAWTWASDDPAAYPGIAPAPRDSTTVTPRPVVYMAPPAPTLAECDEVLRRLAALKHSTVALHSAVIARCTGLRIRQILALRAEDVHFGQVPTLTVTAGKSAREKADRRTIPFAPALVGYLAPLVARRKDPQAWVLTRRSDSGGERGGAPPSDTLRKAWEAATVAGKVRREVWDAGHGRVYGRPDHAFRAAFQAHLVGAGVRDEVIDLLVGHAPGLRGRHYVDASARWDAMVEAVSLIPPLDWSSEDEGDVPDNVISIRGGDRNG